MRKLIQIHGRDESQSLCKLLYNYILENAPQLKGRFCRQQSKMNMEFITFTEEEWTDEWNDLVESVLSADLGLDNFHIFATSNLILRPIIVFSNRMNTTCFFKGIYLPALTPKHWCGWSPAVLGYEKCFIPLKPDSSPAVVPLTDANNIILPVPYLSAEENMRTLLKEYLNTINVYSSVHDMNIVCSLIVGEVDSSQKCQKKMYDNVMAKQVITCQ